MVVFTKRNSLMQDILSPPMSTIIEKQVSFPILYLKSVQNDLESNIYLYSVFFFSFLAKKKKDSLH